MNIAAFIEDARAADPTGTAGIRRSFRAAGKLRLRMFRSQMRQAVVDHDVLGLGGGGLALQPPETRLQAFSGWARVAAEQDLGGPWLSQWIARAWASGEAVGALQTRSEAPGEGSGAWAELAKIELEAISFAVVQALTREAATALTKRRANKTMTWNRMGRAFDKVGPKRIMALANTFCVACHNRGRLAAYRAAGITKVGVIAEQLLPKQALLLPGGLGDHAFHDAKHKGYREKPPARPEYTLSEVEEPIQVGVRTAEDEFVCIECDAFAANSPHDIDDVEDTLPIHPNCRCTWFPWDDRRFRRDAAIDWTEPSTRGQPGNAGQFGPGGFGSSTESKPDPRALALEKGKRGRAKAMAQLVPGKYAAEKLKLEHFEAAGVELDGDEDRMIPFWEEHIGIEPDDFKQAFLGGQKGDMVVKFGGSKKQIKIDGTLEDDQGKIIGQYARNIDMRDRSVDHSVLELDESAQGKGIAKKILAGHIEMYKQMGIEKITTHANIDVGGYAWAKYGYLPDQDSWDILRDRLLTKMADDLPEEEQKGEGPITDLLESEDPRAIWAIADAEGGWGKWLLKDSSWYGSLNLKDTASMARFDAYIAKGKTGAK